IDLREFLLACSQFIDVDPSIKTQFVFNLYDEDRSGFLSTAELIEVLKANHMQSAAAVAKKAATIMRQADADGSGTLSYEDFVTVVRRFPNICFPNVRRQGEIVAAAE
ncbi:hypothetical protein JKP88DRAFT_162319, partial [Tribonema minus]